MLKSHSSPTQMSAQVHHIPTSRPSSSVRSAGASNYGQAGSVRTHTHAHLLCTFIHDSNTFYNLSFQIVRITNRVFPKHSWHWESHSRHSTHFSASLHSESVSTGTKKQTTVCPSWLDHGTAQLDNVLVYFTEHKDAFYGIFVNV